MKISNRDKKILVIILIVAVIALPYVLLIKPTQEKEVALDGEIVTLTERYNYLDGLNQQREFYLSEIDRLTAERDVIIGDFAEGIRQENVIMFLRKLEFDIPIEMTTLSFAPNTITPISAGVTDENGNVTGAIDGLQTQTTVAYNCAYEDVKEFLAYVLNSDERMVVSNIGITYDDATGTVNGSFSLNQYAITGEGRELAPAVVPAMPHGNESIFGTYISDEELAEQLAQDAEDVEDVEEE